MRIIGGEFKRKRLYGPSEKMPTRPIPDLVKEALFNLLSLRVRHLCGIRLHNWQTSAPCRYDSHANDLMEEQDE